MRLSTRKIGSQRSSRPLSVKLVPNDAGQTGRKTLDFEDEHGTRYTLHDISEADARALCSHASTLFHNIAEDTI